MSPSAYCAACARTVFVGGRWMAGADPPRVLSVSKPLFRVMTEAVRLRSNEIGRFACLSAVLAGRAELARRGFEQHEAVTVRGHFATVPTHGSIHIEVQLARSVAICLDEAAERLGAQLRFDATFGDAVSATLFDYLVDRKASEILGGLGLRSGAPREREPAHVQRVVQP